MERLLKQVDSLRDNLGGNLKEAKSALNRLSIEVEQLQQDMDDYDRDVRNFRERFNTIEKKLAKLPPDQIVSRVNKLEEAVNKLPEPREWNHEVARLRNNIEKAKGSDPANLQGRVETMENDDYVTLSQLRKYFALLAVTIMILSALNLLAG